MKKRKSNYKKYRFTYIKTTFFTLFVCLLFVRGYTSFEQTGENFFHVILNGQEMGIVGEREEAEQLLIEARRSIAAESEELVFMEAELEVQGEEVLWGVVDDDADVRERMEAVLRGGIIETMHRSYTLKVNDFIVNLASLDDVVQLLQTAGKKYDSEGKFSVV